MNLLARILSHGFALVVVALIILVLVYRGDLFEEWDLPDFLALKDRPVVTDEGGAGAVDREAAALTDSGDDTATSVAPGPEAVEPEVAEEAVMVPAADTAPADVTETAAEVVADIPAETEPAPAPDEMPVVKPVPQEAVAEPIDSGLPVQTPAVDDEEDSTGQAEVDHGAVPAPVTGEDTQPGSEAIIEDSQDPADTGPSAAAEAPDEQPVEEEPADTREVPAVEAAAHTAAPDASTESSATADVAEEQAVEEDPAETMSAPAAEAPAVTADVAKSGSIRATRYTPADTIVAAWMRAETGVGPSIASGNQTWSGN